jgi:hypothetical protein
MNKIGQRRVVVGRVIPSLYPGEMAHATRVETNSDGTFSAADWLIEPLPGWRGRWLRLRFRVSSCLTRRTP